MSSNSIRQPASGGFDFLRLVAQEADSLWSRICFSLPLSLRSIHIIITVIVIPSQISDSGDQSVICRLWQKLSI